MSSFSLGEEITGVILQDEAVPALQEQVAQLFLEARDDVYRYLLSLGLYPPQAQEGAQEVFLRLYATLKKGEKIQNPRGWIFRVAHNLGLKIRAGQSNQAPFDADLESQIAGSGVESGAEPARAGASAALPQRRPTAFRAAAAMPVPAARRAALSGDWIDPGDQRFHGRRISAAGDRARLKKGER